MYRGHVANDPGVYEPAFRANRDEKTTTPKTRGAVQRLKRTAVSHKTGPIPGGQKRLGRRGPEA